MNNGKTRDPLLPWPQECRQHYGLVGLYSLNGFSSIKYGRCCSLMGMSRAFVFCQWCIVD